MGLVISLLCHKRFFQIYPGLSAMAALVVTDYIHGSVCPFLFYSIAISTPKSNYNTNLKLLSL